MKWEAGRQGTGYEKLLLVRFLTADLYVLRYRPGSYVPDHRDPVEGFRHYRANVELRRARRGGEFRCGRKIKLGRLVLFRPDRDVHQVTRIEEGTRYVLSMGVALPNPR